MKNHRTKLSLIALSVLLAHIPNLTQAATFLPLTPKAYVEGYFGDYNFGAGEGILPLYGNNESMFFLDEEIKGGKGGEMLVSTGGGYRGIMNNFILGAYLFGDYNRTPAHNNVWVFNPGIEFMTNSWDVHLNGYIPTEKEHTEIRSITGQGLGTNQFVSFSGHSQFDHIFSLTEQVGTGLDGEVGYTIPQFNRTRLFIGGYYFSFPSATTVDVNGFKTDNLSGVEGGFEYPVNRYLTVGFNDSYDNYAHNTAALTLRVNFGGIAKGAVPDIHDRMLDQIPRHVGTINTGAGIRVRDAAIDGGRVLIDDNIWFFTPTGAVFNPGIGFANCTFESPCFLETAATSGINGLTGSVTTDLFVAPGIYNLGGGTNPQLTIFSFQNLSGRTEGFVSPASGATRPQINGQLNLNGNNVISNLIINNSVANPIVIGAAATGPVTLNNLDVNASGGAAIAVENGSDAVNLDINNSTININNPEENVVAIHSEEGTLNLNNSIVNATGTTSFGIEAEGDVTGTNSIVTARATEGLATAILATGEKITFTHSTITANSVTNAVGIGGDSDSIINLTDSTVSASGTTSATGVNNADILNLINSDINVNSQGTALPTNNIDPVNQTGTSQCRVNGADAPCA